MNREKYSLGLDFGTESARAVLVELSTGEMAGSTVYRYAHGVIDSRLPIKEKVALEPDWALQDPEDYRNALQQTIPALLKKTKVKPEQVVGIGIDFTSCTILPVKSDGTPLCAIPAYRKSPHSWVKLWKHHAAQPEADRINQVARARGESFLARYGGKTSSEWFFAKALEILNDSPEIYAASEKIIEAQDWLVWQMTGTECRSACGAGYKALRSKKEGFPSPDFFAALDLKMKNIVAEKIGARFFPPGHKAGGLTAYWASKTGLKAGTPVAVSIIDAHSSVLGCGVARTQEMVLCLGTSTCHLLLSVEEKVVEGCCGVVEDGIVPGYFGYEAGQAAVGDIFAWCVKNCAPGFGSKKNADGYALLEKRAGEMTPGASGLLALDWWNGNRSVLVNANLSGLILGYTLATQPHEVYRALLESTALGTMRIIQSFEDAGVPVKRLVATGGLAERSPLLLQIYADVTGRALDVSTAPFVCASGAAILGAVAAGTESGHSTIQQAAEKMARFQGKKYRPNARNHAIHTELYREYCRLHDYFGRGENPVMKNLRDLKFKSGFGKKG